MDMVESKIVLHSFSAAFDIEASLEFYKHLVYHHLFTLLPLPIFFVPNQFQLIDLFNRFFFVILEILTIPVT